MSASATPTSLPARYRRRQFQPASLPSSSLKAAAETPMLASNSATTAPPLQPISERPSKKFATSVSTSATLLSVLSIILEGLRILTGIVLLSAALSWFITGDSLLWGWRGASWTHGVAGIRAWLNGPILLTPAELAKFDGSDPDPRKPIYVGLNGTIFDVSASRSTYGPGGPYHLFAGKDATRAFVTGCFREDQTSDIRGVEQMFMPVYKVVTEEQFWADLKKDEGVKVRGEIDGATNSRDSHNARNGRNGPVGPKHQPGPGPLPKKKRADKHLNNPTDQGRDGNQQVGNIIYVDEVDIEADRKAALKNVHDVITHWAALLGGRKGNRPYFEVGKIKVETLPGGGEAGDARAAVPTLCDLAKDARPTITVVQRKPKEREECSEGMENV